MLWDPCVPCFHPDAGNDEYGYEHESNDFDYRGELEVARSTHSADYVDLGNRDREGARERRYSLPGDVRVLRREIGRREGRGWVGGIRVEGRIWRWLRACEEAAEREDER